ncbi:MAG: GIY-YIG nuclease family protein [Patescibacteria group bacterium]
MTLEQFKKKSQAMPESPGVYFFLGKRKEVLYIGKAASLRDRVRSYFIQDIAEARSPLIGTMVARATSLDWRKTDSVLEALMLEAHLIKNYKPRYNTDAKDDKSWHYVVIQKEDFPRVLLVRGKELSASRKSFSPASGRRGNASKNDFRFAYTFGPFPHGLQLKEALKIIRKIFTYRDTCTPCSSQLPKVRPSKPSQGQTFVRCKRCFNAQIGLCPGVCSGEISKAEYKKIIRRIVLLFSGKKQLLMKNLERDMKRAAHEEEFEEAQLLSRQIFALKHIQDIALIKDEYRSTSLTTSRIEAYDVAHLGGSAAVGVMTVVEDGQAQKSDYRTFRIRASKPGDDTGALCEILSRRLGHDEWPLPRFIVVDGSTAQINAAQKTLESYGIHIPIVGVVKDEKHRPREIKGLSTSLKVNERDILLANAEAHRFAVGYHRRRLRGRVRNT